MGFKIIEISHNDLYLIDSENTFEAKITKLN
jgi:hypothetical protein